MSAPLFNKNIPHSCAWCKFGKKSEYNDDILCIKKGITSTFDSCRHYKYDALKRTPQKQKPADGYSPEDFKL